jgi:anti-sigma-K factor RskA
MNTQLEELASLYVLDQLDAAERAQFEARLVEDAELQSVVRDLESTMAARVRALPQHEPPLDLLDAIERKLPAAPAATRPQRSPKIVGFPWIPFARWGVAAVIAVSLATLAVQSVRRSHSPVVVFVQLDSNRSTATKLSLPQTARDSDARFIELASLAESYWGKPAGMPQPSGGAHSPTRGYALFDPASKAGFIAVEQLPAIAREKQFHLWIVDSSTREIRDAGILPTTAPQGGLYSFSLPQSENTSGELNFFVTIEDSAADTVTSPVQPRGEVVLGRRTL